MYTLVSPKQQPDGNTKENCLTTFKPDNNDTPMWYDRPCNENDKIGEPGHRFMCECNVFDECNISGKIFPTFHLIREADGFICIFFTLASDSATVSGFDSVNPPKSKVQCDEKCGFFGSRDVSKITKSDGSLFTYALRGVLIPFVGILGLVGNILSIIIFKRPEMKIWNFNGSYEMTKTSFIIISKKSFIKDKNTNQHSSWFIKLLFLLHS